MLWFTLVHSSSRWFILVVCGLPSCDLAEEGVRVVDKKKVATVDLCGREVVDGANKRAWTRGDMKIDILQAVEG